MTENTKGLRAMQDLSVQPKTGCLWSEQGQKAATSFHVRPGQKVPLFACEGSKWDSHVNTNCQLNAWTLLRLT